MSSTVGLSEDERYRFLLATLLDSNEALELRLSAVLYLGNMDHPQALQSLIHFASNKKEHKHLLISCGDAIARIWDRNKNFDLQIAVMPLAGPTKREIRNWMNSK